MAALLENVGARRVEVLFKVCEDVADYGGIKFFGDVACLRLDFNFSHLLSFRLTRVCVAGHGILLRFVEIF